MKGKVISHKAGRGRVCSHLSKYLFVNMTFAPTLTNSRSEMVDKAAGVFEENDESRYIINREAPALPGFCDA